MTEDRATAPASDDPPTVPSKPLTCRCQSPACGGMLPVLLIAMSCGGPELPVATRVGKGSPSPSQQPTMTEGGPRSVAAGTPLPEAKDPAERIALVHEGSIWLMKPDGSGAMRSTSGGSVPDQTPALSPRGDRVAFSSVVDGASRIYLVSLDSLAVEPVTDGTGGGEVQPAWSPSGSSIAFMRGREGERRDLFLLDNLEGNGQPRLLLEGSDDNPESVGWPAWAPNGKTIVLSADRRERLGTGLWQVTVDGSSLRRLTRPPMGLRWVRDLRPAFSPDGRQIAFASNRHASGESGGGDLDVYVLATDTGQMTRLTHDPGVADDPCYSPDSQRIYFTSTRDAASQFSVEVFAMPAIGGEQRRLTKDAVPVNHGPSAGKVLVDISSRSF
ncbi:MAG: hypothetical protein V2A73_17555 [Pseudomonadota bacterium]